MIDRDMIAPAVHRVTDLTGGPVNILVPPGFAYVIYNIEDIDINLNNGLRVQIGQKMMFWTHNHSRTNTLDFAFDQLSIWNIQLLNSLPNRFIPWVAQEGQNITLSSSDDSGSVRWSYYKIDLKKSINEYSDGGKMGKRRTMMSYGYGTASIPLGATAWFLLNQNDNPPGETTFPWIDPVNPDRRYFIHAMIFARDYGAHEDITLDALRMTHEGRDLITDHPVVEAPANVADAQDATPNHSILVFPEPYGIDSNEVVQIWARATNASETDPYPAYCSVNLLMTEEFLRK